MTQPLTNMYQQSQKGTEVTGAFTLQSIKNSSQQQNKSKEPIQLYKQDSKSSDTPPIITEPHHKQQQKYPIQNDMPKKLPLNNFQKSKQTKHKKYASIQSIQQEQEVVQAEHDQIRKFIKKADQLNYENYKKLQMDKRTMPIFNTNSNINIYKSSKNILDEIGDGQKSVEKRIRRVYLHNNGIGSYKNTINNYNKKNGQRHNKSLSYQKNAYNNGKAQKNNKYQQQARKVTKQMQTETEDIINNNNNNRIIKINGGRYTSLEAIEEDVDYQPAIPQKIKNNNFNQQRNNRIFSQTISILNNNNNNNKETIQIQQVVGKKTNKNTGYTEQYLGNLSRTQYQFLNSVKKQKQRAIFSAFNTKEDQNYQTTAFNTNYQTQENFMANHSNDTTNTNKTKKILEPIGTIKNDNLWDNIGVQQPKVAKVAHSKNNNNNKKNIHQNAQIANINNTNNTNNNNTNNNNNNNNSASKKVVNVQTNTPYNKQLKTDNSLQVQKNLSNHQESDSPSEIERNISKISKNKQLRTTGFQNNNNNSNQFARNNMQFNQSRGRKATENKQKQKNQTRQTAFLALYDTQQQLINRTQYMDEDLEHNYVQKAQKSIQAPQIYQIKIGQQQKSRHKPTHPISISFNDKDKQWITNKYSHNKLQQGQKIDPNTFTIKKYRNGVYYGQLTESIQNQQQKKHGYGTIFYFNGRTYQGYFENNLKHGKGAEYLPDGSFYEGDFEGGLKSGKGRYQWGNGMEIYQGQWANGKKNGSGMWKQYLDKKSNKFNMYMGQWKNNKIQGFGVLTVVDGHRYQGQFRNSEKWGLGTERYYNGDTYVGEFRKNRPNGNGQYYWANGGYYKGQFSNGLKHGKGYYKGVRTPKEEQSPILSPPKKAQKNKNKITNASKNKKSIDKKIKKQLPKKKSLIQEQDDNSDKTEEVEYIGQFRNDKQCGFGQEKVKEIDGRVYTYRGNFQNDMRHGFGEISEEDKFTIRGYWINGSKVGDQMPVIAEDELDRVDSLPNYKRKKKKVEPQKDNANSLSKQKSKLKKSISPSLSPKSIVHNSQCTNEAGIKRACGCNRKH